MIIAGLNGNADCRFCESPRIGRDYFYRYTEFLLEERCCPFKNILFIQSPFGNGLYDLRWKPVDQRGTLLYSVGGILAMHPHLLILHDFLDHLATVA